MSALPPDISRLLIAILISFALTQVLFVALLSQRGVAQPLQWWPQQLQIVQGAATLDKERFKGIHTNDKGLFVVDIPPLRTPLSARDYGQVRVVGENLGSIRALLLLAMEGGQTLKLHPSPLQATDQIVFNLGSTTGAIKGLRLALARPIPPTVHVQRIKLDPRGPSPLGKAWTTLWNAWLSTEGWQAYSINFIVGGKRYDNLTSPALAGVTWLSLSVVCWFVLAPLTRKGGRLTMGMSLALLLGIIWTSQDLRWQLDLWQAHAHTLANASRQQSIVRPEPSTPTERIDRLAAPLKSALPDHPVRLMVVSDNRMMRLRLRYALLPHNGYAEESDVAKLWPSLRAGDHLLLVQPFQGARFDPTSSRLIRPDNSWLPVRLLKSEAGMLLLRVEAEGIAP